MSPRAADKSVINNYEIEDLNNKFIPLEVVFNIFNKLPWAGIYSEIFVECKFALKITNNEFTIKKMQNNIISSNTIISFKQAMLLFISQQKDVNKKLSYLLDCVDRSTNLGELFWTQAGLTECSLKTGSLEKCAEEIQRIINNFSNINEDILIRAQRFGFYKDNKDNKNKKYFIKSLMSIFDSSEQSTQLPKGPDVFSSYQV